MRGILLVLVQLVISVLVVGAVLPALLFTFTAARGPKMGLAITATLMAAVFIVLRMAWPRSRQD